MGPLQVAALIFVWPSTKSLAFQDITLTTNSAHFLVAMQRNHPQPRFHPTRRRIQHYAPYAHDTIYVYNDPRQPRTFASRRYARRCIRNTLSRLRAERIACYWTLLYVYSFTFLSTHVWHSVSHQGRPSFESKWPPSAFPLARIRSQPPCIRLRTHLFSNSSLPTLV